MTDHQVNVAGGLYLPDIPAGADTLTAGLDYARAGFYVLPIKRGTKNPGSIVGRNWQSKSSCDPKVITAWFAGTDHGIALHCGRSGVVVFDVDHPERLPGVLVPHLEAAPFQASRPDTPGRGHCIFAMPSHRTIGNRTGRLGGGWGEVRGLNGVIVVAPNGDGRHWVRTGTVPVLPDEVAELLDDASPAEDAATDEQVSKFIAEHTEASRRSILAGLVSTLLEKITDGESRHQSMVAVLAGAMREAAAGFYSAAEAIDVLRPMFIDAVTKAPVSDQQGSARSITQAESEFRGVLAWAVGQALAADPDDTRKRVDEKMPDNAANVRIVEAAIDKDLNDHIAASKTPDELVTVECEIPPVALMRLADVEPERVSWLWPGRIPLGKLVTLDGDPGLGKSTLALSIAAPVTTGGKWPDGAVCEHPGGVLLLSAEDGLADTIRPRLDAARADVTKVHAVQGVPIDDEGTLRSPTIADIVALEAAIRDTGARLLVIDVLMAYLPTGTDSHKDQDIRSTLSRVAAMADRTNCAVLLIRHLTKASGRDPIYRGGGSIGIVGAARAGLLVAPDPDDNDRRVLASVKSNLGPAPESLAYRLIDSPEHGCARVQWDGRTDHTAHTLLTEPMSEVDGDNPAKEFIKDYLGTHGGEASAADVLKAGRGAGFNDQELKDARRRCRKPKISSRKASMGGGWVWAIDPEEGGKPPEGGSERGEGGWNRDVPSSPPSTDDLPPSANPPGAPTGRTPGMTDRVKQALAKANARNDESVPGFRPPAGPDRCADCGFHAPTQGHRENCRQGDVLA
jgi:hypothetical protein